MRFFFFFFCIFLQINFCIVNSTESWYVTSLLALALAGRRLLFLARAIFKAVFLIMSDMATYQVEWDLWPPFFLWGLHHWKGCSRETHNMVFTRKVLRRICFWVGYGLFTLLIRNSLETRTEFLLLLLSQDKVGGEGFFKEIIIFPLCSDSTLMRKVKKKTTTVCYCSCTNAGFVYGWPGKIPWLIMSCTV